MKVNANNFVPAVKDNLQKDDVQEAVHYATKLAYNKRLGSMFEYGKEHGEGLRQQAAEAKRRALRNLPDLLEKAEANMQANGIEVLWAADADEANRMVVEIARQTEAELIVKSKSMATEEIGLNAYLEQNDITVVETDLGELIVQLDGDTPGHLVTPAVHKSKDSIRDLFVRELGMEPTDDAEEMTMAARRHLRKIFLNADMGISGGNFIIAETGTVCLVTNEGNARLTTVLPKVHVAIVGIEKLVDTVDDYATLTQVLPRSAIGQTMPVYTHMLNGPRRADETSGPEKVYVILLDNGRSRIYNTTYTEALACIRCGACLNACPVYRIASGHAYGWVYPGPIGAILTPLFTGLENAKPLPHASSLCGSCYEVCPVQINIPAMLLDLRRDLVKEGLSPQLWDWGMKGWALAFSKPGLFTAGGTAARLGTGLLGQNIPFAGAWTNSRDMPEFADKSFRQQWQERQKGSTDEQS